MTDGEPVTEEPSPTFLERYEKFREDAMAEILTTGRWHDECVGLEIVVEYPDR